jgi:hypothetical protein
VVICGRIDPCSCTEGDKKEGKKNKKQKHQKKSHFKRVGV